MGRASNRKWKGRIVYWQKLRRQFGQLVADRFRRQFLRRPEWWRAGGQ